MLIVVQAAQEPTERIRRAAQVEIAAMKVWAVSHCYYISRCCGSAHCSRDCCLAREVFLGVGVHVRVRMLASRGQE